MSGAHGPALRLDRAIDAILGRGVVELAADDDGLGATVRLLRDTLPRLHPRFGFEELLAARLAAARSGPASRASQPIPLRAADASLAPAAADQLADATGAPDDDGRPGAATRARVLRAGGAIASGVSLALPLAGAAIVIWRRSRSPGSVL